MIFLLGETAAAQEINQQLSSRGTEFLRIISREQEAKLLSPAGIVQLEGEVGRILHWLEARGCSRLIDASHPSSSARLTALRHWCEQKGIPYLRLERPETKIPDNPLVHAVQDWEEAVRCLRQRVEQHNLMGRHPTVFVTTGSHQLESLINIARRGKARLVVRVLPEGRLVQKCQDIGIPPRDIVAMQGTFSKDINRALFKFYNAHILLTRDSGSAGGTDTKLAAALDLNMEVVMIRRSGTGACLTVHSVRELLNWLETK